MADTGFDFETEDDVPTAQQVSSEEIFDDPEDFEFAPMVAIDQTAEELENDQAGQLPLGWGRYCVTGFPRGKTEPEERWAKMPDGTVHRYTAFRKRFYVGKKGDKSFRAEDAVVIPPSDPKDLRAYYDGIPLDDKQKEKPGSKGLDSRRFFLFITAMDFPWEARKPLPVEACKVKNWKDRDMFIRIDEGNLYLPKNSKDGKKVVGRNRPGYFGGYKSLGNDPEKLLSDLQMAWEAERAKILEQKIKDAADAEKKKRQTANGTYVDEGEGGSLASVLKDVDEGEGL